MLYFKVKKKSFLLSFIFIFHNQTSSADWKLIYQEDFENIKVIHTEKWQKDDFPDDDKFSENGRYFSERLIKPPQAYRLTTHFGQTSLSHTGWLTAESYTLNRNTDQSALLSIQLDPVNKNNKVLKLSSPNHTDATLIRSSEQLQGRYRVSLKVGFPNFGSGEKLNGYDGDERANPWLDQSSTSENGFYWLAITDTVPRPHNNIWLHHHRKIVIDSDNHFPAWSQVWNGTEFIDSGKHPIMLFALNGNGETDPLNGKPFISFSHSQWQRSGQIKAVDSYLTDQWYELVIERNKNQVTVQISGHFKYGGEKKYTAEIDLNQQCVWHYNRAFDHKNPNCKIDSESGDKIWPDYFFFGDPHINFYEGEVSYDDIKLEMWREE